jgi:hypothetical protein
LLHMPERNGYAGLFGSMRVLWQCRAGHSCLGACPTIPIRIVTCVDDSITHDLIEEREGIRFFSLEAKAGERHEGSDSAIDRIVPAFEAELEGSLRECSERSSEQRWVFLASISSRTLSEFAARMGHILISNPPNLCHWLTSKQNLFRKLADLNLPRIPGRWTKLSEARYSELARELGATFVAQLSHGTSGSGTAFINSETEYARAAERFGYGPVWVAPDLGGLSVNINAIAMSEGVLVSYPSVQLVGLQMLQSGPGMYCGNDYVATADISSSIISSVVQQTAVIGRCIASLGFRGLFGLDFVIDLSSSKAYAVDLNPRWQGSTAPLTLAESKTGRFPLVAAGLACGLGLIGESELLRRRDDFLQPVKASHISLRAADSRWSEITAALPPGVYSCDASFLRPGLRFEDLENTEEVLVTGSVPRKGALMARKAHVLRVSSERQVMNVARLEPLRWSRTLAESLYAMMALRPVEAGTAVTRD